MKKIITVVFVLFMSGCTTIKVEPVTSAELNRPSTICIKENPKVYADFLPIMRSMIEERGFSTILLQGNQGDTNCKASLDYTARRSWDLAPFLSLVDIDVMDANNVRIGSAHLKISNGFNFNKFRGEEAKLTPVLDQLLPK